MRNAFQNAYDFFFQKKKTIKKICVPSLPKMFRPITRNTLICVIWPYLDLFCLSGHNTLGNSHLKGSGYLKEVNVVISSFLILKFI